MKKKAYKKQYTEKLFTVDDIGVNGTFLFEVGNDVKAFAYKKFKYNLNDPKKIESFLRKCFRSLATK